MQHDAPYHGWGTLNDTSQKAVQYIAYGADMLLGILPGATASRRSSMAEPTAAPTLATAAHQQLSLNICKAI